MPASPHTVYPGADTKAQWFQDDYPGATIRPNVGVVHTTETTGWPGYGGGASAPTMTAKPRFGPKGAYLGLDLRQHFPFNKSARALQNDPGGVETNTLNAFQIELVGTCSAGTHNTWDAPHLFWPAAPMAALEDLGELVAWLHTHYGIPVHGPSAGWLAYPASYGDSLVRMTGPQWSRFTGWCGHQHVPENDHGDPGNLNWGAVERAANAILDDHHQDPGWEPLVLDVSTLQKAFRAFLDDKPQTKGRAQVRRLQRALNQVQGASLRVTGKVDDATVAAWAHHEHEEGGNPRPEVPDMKSLKALAGDRYQVRK